MNESSNVASGRASLTEGEWAAIVAVNHCQPDGAIMRGLAPVIEGILAAREQTLREEIARENGVRS